MHRISIWTINKSQFKIIRYCISRRNIKGLILEIEDGAYPLLNSVSSGSDPNVLFKDLDVGVFIGGFPRK